MGDLSDHFSRKEFRCPCCGAAKVDRALVAVLERIRKLAYTEGGLLVVSGYRCPAHNAGTPNAAKFSQHLLGKAADIPARITPEQAKACGAKGIGIAANGLVVHVDVGPARKPWHYDTRGRVVS